jgi:hypothetical protein
MSTIESNVYLKWNEPAAVRRWEWAAAIRRERPVIFGVSMLATVVLRAITTNPKSPGWPASVMIAIGGGVFFGLVMPWFMGLFPSQILMSAKGINRNAPRMWGQFGFMSIHFWKWDVMRGYRLTTIVIGDRSYRTIELMGETGRLVTIGLARNVSQEAIEAILRDRGVPLGRD